MKINFFSIFFIMIILCSSYVLANNKTEEPKLSWEKAEKNMRHFRAFSDALGKSNVSTIGIEGRFMSGSGQFTGDNILQLADKVKQAAAAVDKIIVIDTRMESHGFINGLPVSWKTKYNDANLHKSADEIIKDEKARLLGVFKDKTTNEVGVTTVSTEEEIAAVHEFEYVRLPTLDHSRPSDDIVDAYLELIKESPNAWLHMHCHVGKGRTTAFMAMYDMYYNAKDLEFDEILSRQYKIGGEDLKKHLNKTDLEARKKALFKDRFDFLKRFYRYCRDSDPENVTWQAWSLEQR